MNPKGTAKGTPGAATDPGVLAAATRAAELVTDGAKVGLGSGRAASAFIAAIGARARRGLKVSGVPTSEASARLARSLEIPLIDIDEETLLDLTVDGADEVSPNLDLVKGRGAAFVRERIVAAASRRQVILVSPEKLVPVLCAKAGFPVEVIPMAAGLAIRRLKALGLSPVGRADPAAAGGGPLISVNGNLIFDCACSRPLAEPALARTLETAICRIPGVVDTGLFLGTAERVLVGYPDGRVDVLKRSDLP
jgi:ribose 5-phosphate isomerase A